MSFDKAITLSPMGSVADADIVQFDATSLGENTTSVFSLYFVGSDVGLDTSGEDIDALEILPGNILISTRGSLSVSGLSAKNEDNPAFTWIILGADTSAT